MPRYRTAYPPEFRRQMVDLVRSGRTPEELAGEFEPTAQSISTWVKQAERDAGKRVDGRQALSGRNWRAFDVRTIACVRSATSWQRRQPGSRGRARRARTGLPVRERAPALIPGCRLCQDVALLMQAVDLTSKAPSSSRSALVGPSTRLPASRSACFTQAEIDCAVGSNSRTCSSGLRHDRTRSTICRRNSGG